jgi:hypothetical protein
MTKIDRIILAALILLTLLGAATIVYAGSAGWLR